jgi:hypothetical protein
VKTPPHRARRNRRRGGLGFFKRDFTAKATDENEFLRRSAARSIGQIAQFTQIRKTRVVTPENFLPAGSKPVTLEKYENLAARFPALAPPCRF